MARYKIEDVDKLLKELGRDTRQSIDRHGFGKMADAINGSITQDYLYYSIWTNIETARRDKETFIKLQTNKLDEISQFLGFANFNSFLDPSSIKYSVPNGFLGSYYSFLRKNGADFTIFQSPVEIKRENHLANLTLKGPQRIYKGDIHIQNGCMYCLMASMDKLKSFYHVYKVGVAIEPNTLQGIFTGISSYGDPIGGRCLLIKQKEEFKNLSHHEIDISVMRESTNATIRKIANYFEIYEENNLSLGNLNDYGL